MHADFKHGFQRSVHNTHLQTVCSGAVLIDNCDSEAVRRVQKHAISSK